MGAVQPESGNRIPVSLNWKNISLFLVTIGVLYLCGLIALPFLPAITGAVVLATITAKPYDWLRDRLGMPTVASAIALIAVVFIIILPVSVVVGGIGRHALDGVKSVRSGSVQRSIDTMRGQHPRLVLLLDEGAQKLDLTEATQKATKVTAGWLGGLLSNSLKAVIQLVIMLFLLFFLYRDRQQALAALRLLLPLQQEEADYLLGRVSDTIYATVLGRLVVASVQAALAGLAYWALGVPGAFLWATVTLALSCIPGLGAFLVWLPVAIYLGVTDHWIKAVIMVAWGGLVVSTIDNVLYPVLVGSRLRLHAIPIFFSVLGGIALFGVPGLVLGPVILTIAISLLHIWRKRSPAEERNPTA
jgi:predicted PurR-regulated permease PerM